MDTENEFCLHCPFCRGKNSYCVPTRAGYSKCTSITINESQSDSNFECLLPESIILHIFSYLTHRELLFIRCVSRKCKRIAEDRHLWRYLNLSCKRVFENNFIFRLPNHIRGLVKTVNLMWAHISVPSFNSIKQLFVNMEILLMQYCKFALQFKECYSVTESSKLPVELKILDLRNVHGRWFDDANAISSWPNIEAMAFSQSMPQDWMCKLSAMAIPNLRILCIENNPGLTDAFMSGIVKNAPFLQSISLHGCMYITGTFFKTVEKYSSHIETIDLSGTRLEGPNVNTVDWPSLRIKSFNISFCCKIYESDLSNILPKLKHLEQFRGSFAGWGRALSDTVLLKMISGGELKLETIDIQSTFNLSVESLAKLCKHSPQLKHLRIGTMLKTSHELRQLLESIPKIKTLSLQLGDASFSADYLFQLLALHCQELESLFCYNASFDCDKYTLRSGLKDLFASCSHLKNFFTGGFAHHVRRRVDEIINSVTDELGIEMNTLKPTRIIPLPRVSFDRYLCDVLTRSQITKGLKVSIQRTLNSQSFYKTGLQKLDEYHFSLLRS